MVETLLDTTVLVDAIRGHPRTLSWLAVRNFDALTVSSVTVGELYRGVHYRHAAAPAQLARALERLREDTLKPFEGRILPFDHIAAEIWGRIMGEGAASGRLPPTDDAKIAAVALQHRLTVATSNPRHFAGLVATVDPRTA